MTKTQPISNAPNAQSWCEQNKEIESHKKQIEILNAEIEIHKLVNTDLIVQRILVSGEDVEENANITGKISLENENLQNV